MMPHKGRDLGKNKILVWNMSNKKDRVGARERKKERKKNGLQIWHNCNKKDQN
jgi:hypothetical protein